MCTFLWGRRGSPTFRSHTLDLVIRMRPSSCIHGRSHAGTSVARHQRRHTHTRGTGWHHDAQSTSSRVAQVDGTLEIKWGSQEMLFNLRAATSLDVCKRCALSQYNTVGMAYHAHTRTRFPRWHTWSGQTFPLELSICLRKGCCEPLRSYGDQ